MSAYLTIEELFPFAMRLNSKSLEENMIFLGLRAPNNVSVTGALIMGYIVIVHLNALYLSYLFILIKAIFSSI